MIIDSGLLFWATWQSKKGLCRTVRLDTLVSTRSTRPSCRVVSRRDVTSQVEFGPYGVCGPQ